MSAVASDSGVAPVNDGLIGSGYELLQPVVDRCLATEVALLHDFLDYSNSQFHSDLPIVQREARSFYANQEV